VRDGDGGVVSAEEGRQGRIDERFRFGVEGRRRFVEDEDVGVFDQRARDGDALFLAAGELGAAGSDGGFEAVGLGRLGVRRWLGMRGKGETYKVTDELAVGLSGCCDDLGSGRARFTICDVFCDGAREQYRLLANYTNLAP
jgi:hypothetical protein